ncbi:MAG: U32 family peptidase [Muribaculaceae bacterium]|nr:U32 family peptidase [Muribaculaceae bacterium]
MSKEPVKLELLAPARTAEVAIEAIRHGADAVYIGGPAFGARAAAGNSIEDIRKVVEYAHSYHARVYVTVNTILYPDEIEDAKALVHKLYEAGVDALIVQDMAFIEMRDQLPPIALHASTQCDIRTPEKAVALANAGFEQLVLPRELSLEETRIVRSAVPPKVELEAFVHGALCVSYSGDCQAGFIANGRSANRGECPQMCRLPYSLTDARGNELAPAAHYLSLKDLKRIDSLREMADAGVTSFKIEGRLKDESYVKNVVAAYSAAMDRLVAESRGKYVRRSHGHSSPGFKPDIDRTFNRGYTPYFLNGRPSNGFRMASMASPKWAGRAVARVLSAPDPRKGGSVEVEAFDTLNNGDGLTFTRSDGSFEGFRLNRVEGCRIFPASPVALKPGMTLFRNVDKAFMDSLERNATRRTIPVDITLQRGEKKDEITLTILAPEGLQGKASMTCEYQQARTEQEAARRRVLEKLGDSEFELHELHDTLGDSFVAASLLSDLRRRAVSELQKAYANALPEPAKPSPGGDSSFDAELDYHANVSNPLARKFYEDHGSSVNEEAVERHRPSGPMRVMTTRYCLRRELGECLRENCRRRLPDGPLYLRSTEGTSVRYRLKFDCNTCQMEVWTTE